MMERQADRQTFAARHVAFTGRLASMSRRAATEMVERRGGKVSLSVNRRTDLLVVGREGWPLRPDGRLTRKLHRAKHLQRQKISLEIIAEEQFLQRLDLNSLNEGIRRSCSIAELTELLGLPRSRIEAWHRAGLLSPVERREGIPYFDFQQVTAIRSLHRLVADGVPPGRLERSLNQLRKWLKAEIPNFDLLPSLRPEGKRFLFRTNCGQLVETTGQLRFEFEEEPEISTLPYSSRMGSNATFEEASQLEQEGKLPEAAARYRQLLLDDGLDAEVCFNLANVLQAMHETQAAIERYHEAVTLDPDLTDAWNNLGNLLAETGELPGACVAYRRAVDVEPDYADAHYGLADVLEMLGQWDAAQGHWQSYLRLVQDGPWAQYARERLSSYSA